MFMNKDRVSLNLLKPMFAYSPTQQKHFCVEKL